MIKKTAAGLRKGSSVFRFALFKKMNHNEKANGRMIEEGELRFL
jgi:hypothetical protein